MAATVSISETNGAGVTTDLLTNATDIANLNYGSTDQPNLDPTLWPIRPSIPQSFIKYFRIVLVDAGGSSVVNDLRVWKSAGAFTNFENIISGGLTTSNVGAQPFATPTNLGTLASGFPAVPTANPGAQNLGINGANNSDTGPSMPANGNYSSYFAQQMQINVGGTSALGPMPTTKVYTFQYDEA